MNADQLTLHGTFLNILGVGTLITGEPGIGKSELALGLLDRHHQLIADDAPCFSLAKNKIMAENLFPKHFLFVRGIGMIDVTALFGPKSVKKSDELHLIIELKTSKTQSSNDALTMNRNSKNILGCLIPSITLPMMGPRNLPILVETIVKTFLIDRAKKSTASDRFEALLLQTMGQLD